MIRLGINTWLWTDVFTEEYSFAVEASKRLGFEVVDFSIANPDVFPTEKIARLVREHDIEVVTSTVLPLVANPVVNDEVSRKNALTHMKKMVDITRELGGTITGGVNYTASGYLSGAPRSPREVESSVAFMKEVADYALNTSDVVIAVEPVKRFESHILSRAEQAIEYIGMVDRPNMGVHLDTFHMNIEEADPIEAILSCGDKLKYMHLVENNRGAPGMGHIPWVDVFKALKRIGFDGPTAIEVFNQEKIDEMYPLVFLSQKYADTNEEFALNGLRHLKAVNTIVFGS